VTTTTVVGANLRRLRKERGFSQTALSELSGVPQQTISELETGPRSPHQRTLTKLADALGVPMMELYREGGNHPLAPLPRAPLANSTPEELERRLYGAPVEEIGGELAPVVTEEEARELSDALRREEIALEGWIRAYAAAPSEVRFERRADHERAKALRRRARFLHDYAFNTWSKIYDPRPVPFLSARQFAAETDQAAAMFIEAMRSEAERGRAKRAGAGA
jgi:transcriptional regulator with XRE-family HTH domain